MQKPKGPSQAEVILRSLQFGSDFIGAHQYIRDHYGTFTTLRFAGKDLYYYFSPELVQVVLKDHAKKYAKSWFYNELRPLIGNSLLLSEGEDWKRQRRSIAPVFHAHGFPPFVKAMTEETEKWISEMQARGFEHAVNVEPETLKIAFKIFVRTLFGSDIGHLAEKIASHFLSSLAFANWRIQMMVKPPRWFLTPGELKDRRNRKELKKIVQDLIRERRDSLSADSSQRPDILTKLLLAQDPDSKAQLTDEEVENQITTFLAAGHDTTGSGLMWTLYCLARHPEFQDRARDEVQRVCASGGELTYELLSQCEYLERVVLESLRLYPPAPGFSRDVVEEDFVAGYPIPKGAVVVVNVHVLHHDPEIWPDPTRFDPDRFLPAAVAQRHPYAYIPFSAGPRACIGEKFAMLELKAVVATILRRLRLSVVPGKEPQIRPTITLRSKAGVHLKFERV